MSVNLQELIKLEKEKCKADYGYAIRKYFTIQHPVRGKVLFDLYPFQEKVLEDLQKHRWYIINKSRQLGISTLAAAYGLCEMLFKDDFNVLVIATKQDVAKNLITKIRVMNENLPSWMKVPTVEDNKLSLRFSNGSQVKAVSSKSDSGRSESLSLLIIDEAAFVPGMEELWASLQPTLSVGGSCLLLSCVTKDTFVYTDKGIKQVKDFIDDTKVGGYEIKPYTILGMTKLRKGNLFKNNGKVKTYKIKTTYSELEGSFNHKLWAYKNETKEYGWYTLEDLSIGDYVSIQKGKEVWGNNDKLEKIYQSNKSKKKFNFDVITPDLSYLFGLYISEGSSYKVYNKNKKLVGGNIDFCCGDDISQSFINLGVNYYLHKDNIHYSISSKYFIELFEQVGFDLSKKAHEKEIPSRLLEMSESNIIALLQGMFDGDGFCDSIRKRIGYTSSSEKLIDQIRMILLNFGILSCKYKKEVEQLNKNNKFEYDFKYPSYVLEINYNNSIIFSKKINFKLDRKRSLCDRFINEIYKDGYESVIPNSVIILNKIKDKYLSKYKKVEIINKSDITFIGNIINKNHKYNSKNTDSICKSTSLKFLKAFENEVEFDSKIFNEDILWMPIKEKVEGFEETFDFSLPEIEGDEMCHSIIYNGMIGHQTPYGQGNLFHREFMKAESGEGQFTSISLPWHVHPERNQKWYDEQVALIGEELAGQELECSFISSGRSVIDGPIIQWYKDTYVSTPMEKRGVDGGYWIWEYPAPGKNYLVTADVARGDASDYSTFHVLDLISLTQVAEYKGKVDTSTFGNMLVSVSTDYNDAILVVDNNSVGWNTISVIVDRGYKNLFYSYRNEAYVDGDIYLKKGYDLKDKSDMIPGLSITNKTKPLIVDSFTKYMREKTPIIHSSRLIEELFVYIWNNGKPEAAKGYNDDLVMALAGGLWVRDTALRLKQLGVDLTRRSVSGIKKAVYTQTSPKNYAWDMDIMGKKESIKWLL